MTNSKTLVPLNSVTIADILAAITKQGADQFEYMALEVWFSESIGWVRVRVRTGELDFEYCIDLREPSRCSIRPCIYCSSLPAGTLIKATLFIVL